MVYIYQSGARMQTYPGRASMAPLLDVLMTLLHWGAPGWAAALAAREELLQYARQALGAFAERHGERLLHTPGNPISLALTLDSLGRAGAPGDAGGLLGGEGCLERGNVPGCGSAEASAHEAGSAGGAELGMGMPAMGEKACDRVRTGTNAVSSAGGAGDGEEGMEPAVGGSVDRGIDAGSCAVGPERASECAAAGRAPASSAGAPASSRSAGAAEPLDPGGAGHCQKRRSRTQALGLSLFQRSLPRRAPPSGARQQSPCLRGPQAPALPYSHLRLHSWAPCCSSAACPARAS